MYFNNRKIAHVVRNRLDLNILKISRELIFFRKGGPVVRLVRLVTLGIQAYTVLDFNILYNPSYITLESKSQVKTCGKYDVTLDPHNSCNKVKIHLVSKEMQISSHTHLCVMCTLVYIPFRIDKSH